MQFKSTTKKLTDKVGFVYIGSLLQNIHGSFLKETRGLVKRHSVFKQLCSQYCFGETDYADCEQYRNDEFYAKALGLGMAYSQDTVRLYTEKEDPEKMEKYCREMNVALLSLSDIPSDLVTGRYVVVDMDVTPLDNSDSSKESVGYTYKGYDGYAPMNAYIGPDSMVLNFQLRPGTQHSQKGTNDFIRQCDDLLGGIDLEGRPVLYRLDSGNDSLDLYQTLDSLGRFFIIKKNPRRSNYKQTVEMCLSLHTYRRKWVDEDGQEDFRGTTEYIGVLDTGYDDLPYATVFRLLSHKYDEKGDALLFDDYELELYATNAPDAPETVIALYHDHANCEQAHAELKTDMDVERLSSGKYKVNRILYAISSVSVNIVKLIGQVAFSLPAYPLKKRYRRMRVKSVISKILKGAAEFVINGRTPEIRIPISSIFHDVHRRLGTLFTAVIPYTLTV